MVKRIYHIIVVLFLILGTTGISISQHFCHGKLVSSEVYGHAKSCCNTTCGACENKTTIYRIYDDFVKSSTSIAEIIPIKLFISDMGIQTGIVACSVFSPFQPIQFKAPPPPEYSILPEYLEIFRC